MAERAHPEELGFKDRWFGLKKSHYKKKLYERYKSTNKFIKGKKVLDIPCGVGWGTSLLKGATSVIGIDISKEAIDYAKKHYENDNRKFYIGDMQFIPLENNSIDVLICLEGFEHVTKDIGLDFIKESIRVLKQNGLLIMTCPVLNVEGKTTGNPYHLSEYPEYELIEILNKNFRMFRLERIKGPDGPEYRAVLINIKKGRYKREVIL
ncbi:class I SAM-dependent methyltransferase [bacterium]|nr:class I SAM-dependent methyltransferase [bacterium]